MAVQMEDENHNSTESVESKGHVSEMLGATEIRILLA